jgi:hypothetical protein
VGHGHRPYLDEQIQSLDEALTLARIAVFYRVAIVGRFKVGSSFSGAAAGMRRFGS